VWTTETYSTGDLQKDGVGISIDAGTDDGGGIVGKRLVVRTKTPGFTAAIYGATDGAPEVLDGWTELAEPVEINEERFGFDINETEREYRHYLVWITALPPEGDKVELSEIFLFQKR
jgi:hypothetical protein